DMSSASSAVTYTSIYTDSEPGRVFRGANEELSDGGLEEPQTPPAPQNEDEHELMFIQSHDPDFMPEPIYPEYIPLEDEHILPAEEQPLPPVVLPTTKSTGYIAESDPEEDLEEYEEDEAEDGPVDYPMDGGYDGDDDDDDGDSSRYDADDEDEDEEDKEEEEHLALADSVVAIPIDELVSTPEGTELAIPPPSTDIATIEARITIRPQTSISLQPEAEVERLLAIPTPSPSSLTSLSPPSVGERLTRCMASAALPSPPLPSSLYPPPPVDRRDGIPEYEQPPCKWLCLATLGFRYEKTVWIVEEEAYAARKAWAQLVGLNQIAHHELQTLREQTVWIVEEEAYAAREAWAQLVGLNQTAHHELQTLREQVYAQEYQLQAHKAQLQLQSTLIQTQQQLHETHSQMQQTKMAGLQETNRL
nr:hypothetical protein [Tanacetum cinerariifolium]